MSYLQKGDSGITSPHADGHIYMNNDVCAFSLSLSLSLSLLDFRHFIITTLQYQSTDTCNYRRYKSHFKKNRICLSSRNSARLEGSATVLRPPMKL